MKPCVDAPGIQNSGMDCKLYISMDFFPFLFLHDSSLKMLKMGF